MIDEATTIRYSTVLIDADNTLFDYDKAEQFALKAIIEKLGMVFNKQVHDTYRTVNSKLWKQKEQGLKTTDEIRTLRFKQLFEELEEEPSLSLNEISNSYLSSLGQAGFALEGALELCRTLKEMNVTLSVVTNGIKEVQHNRFNASQIKQYIDHIIISDEIGAAKPAPDIFKHALSISGNPDKATVLMVGDSLSADIKGGNDFGIATCWYNPAKTDRDETIIPDYEINDLMELIQIIIHKAA